MNSDGLCEESIKNIFFKDGASIFEAAIAHGNYEIANYLLDINTPLNILVLPEKYNEFHIIAPHLRDKQAVAIANVLLERGVDLKHQDSKYGNTAMFSLTHDILMRPNDDSLNFLQRCYNKREGLFEKNKRGYCTMDILNRNGIHLELHPAKSNGETPP